MTNARSDESTVDDGLSANIEDNQRKDQVHNIVPYLYNSSKLVLLFSFSINNNNSFMNYYYSWGSCKLSCTE